LNFPRARILLVDDEPNLRKVVGALLVQKGYEIHAEGDGQSALMRVQSAPRGTFDVVITDLRMPGMNGMELLRALMRHDPGMPVILLTAHGTVDTAVEAVKSGAFDFVEKPVDREQLDMLLHKAVAMRRRAGPIAAPPPPFFERAMQPDPCVDVGMVGNSPAMFQVREMIRTIAASPSTVLVTGESGTGKELVAQALHRGSDRWNRPLIRVNCAAIPATLVESELFGHERGAFTGAVSSRPGRFELAHGGTLFLDEVSEIPLEIQVKLLRAIQESQFERVGGIRTLSVDVRLIAATNRDLVQMIRERRFREDLYYRLNVVPIHLPSLRERREDIPALIGHFLIRANERLRKHVRGFEMAAVEILAAYPWPGNVRELENLVERLVLFASGDEIRVEELPEGFVRQSGRFPADAGDSSSSRGIEDLGEDEDRNIRLPLSVLGLDLKEAVRQGSRLVEEALIREALGQTDFNVTRSARLLGISRRSLQSKMKELGLRGQGEGSKP
jgi:DNA-binding NtrC family response regulator